MTTFLAQDFALKFYFAEFNLQNFNLKFRVVKFY